MAVQKRHFFTNPQQLVRSDVHKQFLNTSEVGSYDGLLDSYKEHDRIKPVYVVRRKDTNPDTEGAEDLYDVIDGQKYVDFAMANNIEKIFVCELTFDSDDDKRTIMFKLQRGQHDSLMALSYMIEGSWSKHYKGQGFRTDIKEEELDEAILGADGRRLNIYERIGRELNLSGTKVKQIRKVAQINPLHFERIEIGRFSLFQAYQESIKEERGEMPPVPTVKAPVYHTNMTTPPVYSSSTTTTGDPVEDEEQEESEVTNTTKADTAETTTVEIPVGNVISMDDDYITVSGPCQHCNKVTFLRIPKNQIYE